MTGETTKVGSGAAAEAVAALDERRVAATVAADLASLQELLADDLVWTHANGNSDSKAEWLAKVGSGKVKYHSFVFHEKRCREFEGTVVINGKGSTSVCHHGGIDTFKMSITAVYARSGQSWQLVAMQVTKIP
jgi:ketosteroid isomerase-like protein